jgi:hypothetical protein
MAAAKFNAEAARAELGDQLTAGKALAEKLDAEIGALTLAVVLDEAPESDLAGAREARANAAAKVAELSAALVALGIREDAQAKADEARQRKADEAERERLVAVVKAASAKAVELADKLAAVCTTACESDSDAYRLETRLGIHQRHGLQHDLAEMVVAKLDFLGRLPMAVPPSHRDAAATRLSAVS